MQEPTMRTAFGLIACALVGASVPLLAQDGAKFDAGKLVGKWQYVSGIKNGTKVAEESLKNQVVTITKDKITLKGEDTFVMKYELDTTKNPLGIKLEMLESPFGAGAKSEGVIEVKDDQIRLCYAPMGEEAPKTFDAKEGTKMHLFVLKRSK
jgi:uncharacterized protein (TIGR03067 family)